jgi:hypothetical protein
MRRKLLNKVTNIFQKILRFLILLYPVPGRGVDTCGRSICFFAILLQINHNNYSSVTGLWLKKIFFFNVRSVSIQSFTDAGNSNITRLPLFKHGVGAMTLSITALGITTLSITTLSITILSITTCSITIKKCDTQHNDTQHNYSNYALCLIC